MLSSSLLLHIKAVQDDITNKSSLVASHSSHVVRKWLILAIFCGIKFLPKTVEQQRQYIFYNKWTKIQSAILHETYTIRVPEAGDPGLA